MAMKKMTGASKPAAKMKSTGSAKKTTVSRGSNTSKQVGDQNMREAFNSNRDVKYRKNMPTTRGDGAKSTVADAKKSYSPKTQRVFKGIAAQSRTAMRKGGKGK